MQGAPANLAKNIRYDFGLCQGAHPLPLLKRATYYRYDFAIGGNSHKVDMRPG